MSDGGSSKTGRLRRPVVLLSWALAAVVAGSVVWWAVAAIGGEQAGARGKVYTQAEVAELADPTPVPSPSTVAVPAPVQTAVPAPPIVTPPPAVPDPADVARTWTVAGGQIWAQCRGPQIALLAATPLDGWTVEVKHGGPEELEVEFRQGEAETSVHAACVDGTPTMVEQDEDED